MFSVSKQTISKSISSLSKSGYINIKYDYKEVNNAKRIITISEVLKKSITSITENINTGVKENLKYNNKYKDNKKNNIPVFHFDDEGNEYWNGKKIIKEEATEGEIQELENLLKEFRMEGEEIND